MRRSQNTPSGPAAGSPAPSDFRRTMMSADAAQSPAPARGPCAWCGESIPAAARRDAVCCSKRCRQAKHRFQRAIGTAERATLPPRLAYADPPYAGNSTRCYGNPPGLRWRGRSRCPDRSAERVRRLGALDLLRGAPGGSGALSFRSLRRGLDSGSPPEQGRAMFVQVKRRALSG